MFGINTTPSAHRVLQFRICIGNSMIWSDIWHKYHERYFKIVSNFTRLTAREITYNNFEISLVVFMPNITSNHTITYTNPELKHSAQLGLTRSIYSQPFKTSLEFWHLNGVSCYTGTFIRSFKTNFWVRKPYFKKKIIIIKILFSNSIGENKKSQSKFSMATGNFWAAK